MPLHNRRALGSRFRMRKTQFKLSTFLLVTICIGASVGIFVKLDLIHSSFWRQNSIILVPILVAIAGRKLALSSIPNNTGSSRRWIAWFAGVLAFCAATILVIAIQEIDRLQDFYDRDLFDGPVFLMSLIYGIVFSSVFEILLLAFLFVKRRISSQAK